MKKALVLQHLDRESPGHLALLCKERGMGVEIHLLGPDAPPPTSLPEDAILIVMGGSMGVGDIGDPRYPFLAKEIDLLRTVLEKGQPVLGICLGAQLLAHAAGARVYPNQVRDERGGMLPCREVGFGHVTRVGGANDPIFRGLGDRLPVVHWHGDTFDLPPGAVHLAMTPQCKHQAFRIGTRAVGLQFHPEVDESMIRCWVKEDADFIIAANGPGGPEQILSQCEQGCAELLLPGRRLLANVLDQLCS